MIAAFMNWWNRLDLRNGKVKFRSQREAADFVRALANKGGPNEQVLEMRRKYVAVQKAQRAQNLRPVERVGAAL